jgi:hypothetical protein
MRLFEFAEADPIVTRLVAVSDQLLSDLSDPDVTSGMTVDDLLTYFQKYDIILDQMDLYNMIKLPPLKNVISNIQGDKIIFKGAEGQDTGAPDENGPDVVAGMAAKAASKHAQ